MRELERRTIRSDLTKIGGKQKKLIGYVATFNSPSEDLGGFREIIAPGAFDETIRTDDVRALWNHNSDSVLGRLKSGTLALRTDSTGLKATIHLPDTTAGQDAWTSVKRGDVSQMSFGFKAIRDSWDEKANPPVRTLHQVELFDVSPVTYPAYTQTEVTARDRAITNKGANSMTTIPELLQRKGELVHQMREYNVPGKEQHYYRAKKDFDSVCDEIRSLEQSEARAKEIASAEYEIRQGGGLPSNEPQPGTGFGTRDRTRVKPGDTIFCPPGTCREMLNFYESPEERRIINAKLSCDPDELRALQMDSDVQGGFMVADTMMGSRMIIEKNDLVFVRNLATIIAVTNADSIGIPEVTNDISDADWSAELKVGPTDEDMDLGLRKLTPHGLTKEIKVSRKLLRNAQNADGLVRSRLAYKFAISEEKAFMTGNGAAQPLGVFTLSDAGLDATRDVSSSNTAGQIKADNLRAVKYSIKSQYRARARWIFSRAAVEMVSKLKDGEGQYLWQAGITRGEPDRLLGFPVHESEYCPDSFGAGLYVGILGDFSEYWIADNLNVEIQVLSELYARSNQIGYIGRSETDASPVDGLAFARVMLAP